jgi:putative transposase
MNMLYKTVGISKQAVAQYAKRQEVFDNQIKELIVEADILRKAHPGCGVEKIYDTLRPDFIGRDRFVETFMDLGYRVKRRKNYRRTTYAGNLYYPNLIKGLEINEPSAIWQSDITYIKIKDKFYYAVFIIDVYSKEIVGYSVSDHMRASANIRALKMALKEHKYPKIHHSDRGSQYTSKEYISLLRENSCKISMGLIAQDNAYAERINRTIKEEYLSYWKTENFQQLKLQVKNAVYNYNNKRVHRHLPKMNPSEFIKHWKNLTKKDKPKITIFNNEII